MDGFTAKGALLTGLDLIRRRPLLILSWAALLLGLTIVGGFAREEFMAWARARISSGQSAAAVFAGPSTAFDLTGIGLALIVTSVLWASAYRAILRPAERPPVGFGLEELCVLGSWTLIQVPEAMLLIPLPRMLISHFPTLDPPLIGLIVRVIRALGVFWSAVASVWAFERLRVAPFRCWRIARGRFWLLALLVIGIAILERLVEAAFYRLALAMSKGWTPHLFAVFQPRALLQEVTTAITGAVMIAFVAGVVASAYRASSKDHAAGVSTGTAGPSS